jgi:hypothetical protein
MGCADYKDFKVNVKNDFRGKRGEFCNIEKKSLAVAKAVAGKALRRPLQRVR